MKPLSKREKQEQIIKKNTDYSLVAFENDTSRSGRSLHLWKMSNLTESQNDWTPLIGKLSWTNS